MSAVMVALFRRLDDAERVRTRLVSDGFPTDRVELTSSEHKGRAGLHPAASAQGQFEQYFSTLLCDVGERDLAQSLARRVAGGELATIAVHPRGTVETSRATQILEQAGASEVVAHDLSHQSYEFAAARTDTPMIGNLLPENPEKVHCFYCWLFPDAAHRH